MCSCNRSIKKAPVVKTFAPKKAPSAKFVPGKVRSTTSKRVRVINR